MAQTTSGPTLTNMTYYGRFFVKFFVIGIVTLMVGRMFLGAAINFWRAMNPEPPPPPTRGFGILPQISFPLQESIDKPSSYRLELPTGKLPSFGDRAKVFLVLHGAPGLLNDQQAKNIAAKLGFVFEPEIIGANHYRWVRSQNMLTTLDMDTINYHFSLSSDYLSQPNLLTSAEQLPSNFDAASSVKSVVGSLGLLPSDVASSSGTFQLLKVTGGELEEAVSYSDADFLQVDIVRYPIDGEHEIFTPDGEKGTIHAILGKERGIRSGILSLEFSHYEVDYTQVHTYPLRSAESAWQVLQAGEGYVARKGEQSQAVIREVRLGYFDDTEGQEYLQPVYVFLGDGGFTAYVSALDPENIQGMME